MNRLFTKNATGVATDGRWYPGDINAIQDAVAALNDLTQTLGVGTIQLGETGLQFVRFGAGEARLTGDLRTDGILRGLGGEVAGAFTTTQRDAIAAGRRPYGLKILNTTTNRYEWNSNTDASPIWLPVGNIPGYGTAFPGTPVDGQEFILVDSTTNPSFQWRFRYNAASTSPFKWECVGGDALIVSGLSTNLPAHAGDYNIAAKCSTGNFGTTTGADVTVTLSVGGVAKDTSTQNQPSNTASGTGSRGSGHFALMAGVKNAASGAVVAMDGSGQGQIAITPVRIS